MKRQIRLGLLGVALAALLTGLSVPGLARADIKVTVLAAEYNDNLLVASVLAVATDGEDPTSWAVSLSVTRNQSSTPVDGEVVEDLIFERLSGRLWKIVQKSDVVEPGDILTAAIGGFSDAASCGQGLPRLRVTAICR